jgi:hypothetical protein
MILRLPLLVRLFNEKGELVLSINSTKKSQIRTRLHALPRAEWQYGTCRVWYNKPNDFWNEFSFGSIAQLDAGLITVTEKPLVDFLHPEIPKQYLEKRQLTAAQQAAITKARQKSSMGAQL